MVWLRDQLHLHIIMSRQTAASHELLAQCERYLGSLPLKQRTTLLTLDAKKHVEGLLRDVAVSPSPCHPVPACPGCVIVVQQLLCNGTCGGDCSSAEEDLEGALLAELSGCVLSAVKSLRVR